MTTALPLNFSRRRRRPPTRSRPGGARAGEEAGGRVQVAGGGHGDAERVRRLPGRLAGGDPGGVADQQAGVVGADRARADQDRVGRRPQRVDLVEVLRAGQDQPVGRPVVEVAVNRDGAAQQRVRAVGHGPYATGHHGPASGTTVMLRSGPVVYCATWQDMRFHPRCRHGAACGTRSSRSTPRPGKCSPRTASTASARSRPRCGGRGAPPSGGAGSPSRDRRLRLLAWKSHLTRYMGRLARARARRDRQAARRRHAGDRQHDPAPGLGGQARLVGAAAAAGGAPASR